MKDGEDRWKRAVSYSKIALSILPTAPPASWFNRLGMRHQPKPGRQDGPSARPASVCWSTSEGMESGKPWSTSPQSPDRYGPRMMQVRFAFHPKLLATCCKPGSPTTCFRSLSGTQQRSSKVSSYRVNRLKTVAEVVRKLAEVVLQVIEIVMRNHFAEVAEVSL
jgi:hypothetical protein